MRKSILFALLLFLIFYSVSYSQQPIKNDTKIIVVPTDSTNIFNRIVVALFEQGYTIESKDLELKFVSTLEKSFGSWAIKIRAIVKDSIIVFSGEIAGNVTFSLGGAKIEKTFSELSYYTGAFSKGNDYRKAWDVLDSFARGFGTLVKYSK